MSRKRKHNRSSKEEEPSKDDEEGDRSKRRPTENHQSSYSAKHREHHVEKERRQIKKAVYKLRTREETEKRQVSQADVAHSHSKSKSTSLSTHNDCPHKAELNIANKDKVTWGSKKKERSQSRSQPIRTSHTGDQKEKKDSQKSSNEKSHRMSPPRLKKKRTDPYYVSEKQRKQCQDLLKGKCKDKELYTPEVRRQRQTTPHSKDSIRDKRTESIKETCQKVLAKDKESLDTKSSTDFSKQRFSPSTNSKVSFTINKSSSAQPKLQTSVHSHFKIPHKLAEVNTSEKSDVTTTSRTATCATEHTVFEADTRCLKQPHSKVKVFPRFSKTFKGKYESPSSSNALPTTCREQTSEQMQVAEELQLARFEKRLEVDVMQSYGELTCMEIDPPEETNTFYKQPSQQDLILVLDTNILLSHLDYVKKLPHHGLGAFGVPIVLIPWVVLQELDSLKRGKGLTESVAHLACPAISYIYNCLKKREKHLWGQSMQQAAEINNNLMAENNDDKVLQCCLQYQRLYPICALILCTNDKNLCSKAVLSGVKALNKIDLESEVERSKHNHLQSTVLQKLPQINPPMSSPMPGRSYTPAPSHTQDCLSYGLPEQDSKNPRVEEEKKMKKCVAEFEDCLQEVLSNVLEIEMKAVYDDLWEEIICIKPPWNLLDILQCLKKHWKAVFGFIVPRHLLQTVLNVIDFFKQAHSRDRNSILVAIQEAKEFVKEFRKRSSHVPAALTAMNNIVHKLQSQPESSVCDVVMNEDDEAKQTCSSHVPHHEVWAMFENIWCKVCEISLEVFKALAFDPHTRQSALPVGGPAPPQDAVVCLSQMSSVVSQLLQAFISVLSSSAGLREVQMLLSTIRSNKMIDVNSRLMDTDLLSCFSQEDYREKLRVGVNQMTELKDALDHCVQTTAQHWP